MTIIVWCYCARHVLVKNEMCVCLSSVSMKHCRSHKLPIGGVHMYVRMYSRIAHTQVGANHRRANAAGTAQSVSSKFACGPATYVRTYVCTYVRTFCRLGWSLAKACGLYTSGLTVSRNTSICRCEGKKTHIRTWYILSGFYC